MQNPPSVKSTAFDCPHCGAYTTQTWYKLRADRINEENRVPFFPDPDFIRDDEDLPHETRDTLHEWASRIWQGELFFEKEDNGPYEYQKAYNLHLSECFNCNKIAVWVNERLIHPQERVGALPNPDLPDDIRADFEEARAILSLSPRGAAALLRLCVQKLCKHLGEKGKNIDDDIASLVKKGLDPLVSQSLDIVRVIGNESVHPGELALKEDQATAAALLVIVNSIADQMISHPKRIQKIYSSLPEGKRKGIEERNAKAAMAAGLSKEEEE